MTGGSLLPSPSCLPQVVLGRGQHWVGEPGPVFLKSMACTVCFQDHVCTHIHVYACVCEHRVSTQMQSWEPSGQEASGVGDSWEGDLEDLVLAKVKMELWIGAWAALGPQGVGLGEPGEGRWWVCPAASPANQKKGTMSPGPGEQAVGASRVYPGSRATLSPPDLPST